MTNETKITNLDQAQLALVQIEVLLDHHLTWDDDLSSETRKRLTDACNHVELALQDVRHVNERLVVLV